MGRLIYQPKGKAREYSPWACNLYNGCTNNCTYCYNKKCVGSKLLGKEDVTLKSGFTCKKDAQIAFQKELDKYKDSILADGKGLFFNFVSDPFLKETWALNYACAEYAMQRGVPCVFLSKKRPNNMMIGLLERYKDLVNVGFTLTGMDGLEPNADTNRDRIEAIKILSERGVQTWASIEPIINIGLSFYLMCKANNVGCREFKIGVLSGKKDYTPLDVLVFKRDVESLFSDCTILWKNSLLEYISQEE
jgi:DNA repair photolyase